MRSSRKQATDRPSEELLADVSRVRLGRLPATRTGRGAIERGDFVTKGLWLYPPRYFEDGEGGVVAVVEFCNDTGKWRMTGIVATDDYTTAQAPETALTSWWAISRTGTSTVADWSRARG